MIIKEIYNLMIKKGREADFRKEKDIDALLKRRKDKYQKLSAQEKKEFDKESLNNPYLDSRVYNASDENKEVKKVLAGIDITPSELLIAKEIGGIDLVISHHPMGKGLAHVSDVMDLQIDLLHSYGVPVNIAEKLMTERIEEVARGVNAANHQRTVDAAKLLNTNLMNSHTPSDNLVASFLKKEVEDKNPERVEDLLSLLKDIPEYQEAIKIGAGPKIFAGSPESRCGKVALTEITGGTEGSEKLYEKMANVGIGTIVGMHQSEKHNQAAKQANINVVVAGHISSDSIGMNLFLDELEKQGVEIVPASGLTRVSRVNK